MKIPRLIVADEIQEGMTPASLLLINALRFKKIPLKIFFCGRREVSLRLMSLLGEDSICCLDPYTSLSARNLKTLFQRTASPNALNIISVPLGTAIDSETFQFGVEAPEMARILDCGALPLLTASASAAVSTNRALNAISAFESVVPNRVQGVIFSSVRSPREYQLLEKEYSRRTPILSLGFMPRSTDAPMPPLKDLSGRNGGLKAIPVKSAALQLAGPVRQLEWQVIEAFSVLNQDWTEPEPLSFQKKSLSVAVMNPGASLEGCGNIEAFRQMGCRVTSYDHQKDPFPMDADVLYFPHTLNEPFVEELLIDLTFRQGVITSVSHKKPILAAGASALLFGKSYYTSDQREIEGLGIFPFSGKTSRSSAQTLRKVEIRGTRESPFTKGDEKLRGWSIEGLSIANPGSVVPSCCSYREMKGSAELGVSGWSRSSCFVTDLRLDLWSNLGVLSRWLTQST